MALTQEQAAALFSNKEESFNKVDHKLRDNNLIRKLSKDIGKKKFYKSIKKGG